MSKHAKYNYLTYLYCSIVTLGLFAILATLSLCKTLYFASYPVTIEKVNGTLSLAVSGYFLKLDSNTTFETYTPFIPYTLSQFKFLLSIDFTFNAAVKR
jgi:hypothetical protein